MCCEIANKNQHVFKTRLVFCCFVLIGISSVEEILQILTWQLRFASGTFFFWVDVPNVSFSQVFLIPTTTGNKLKEQEQ